MKGTLKGIFDARLNCCTLERSHCNSWFSLGWRFAHSLCSLFIEYGRFTRELVNAFCRPYRNCTSFSSWVEPDCVFSSSQPTFRSPHPNSRSKLSFATELTFTLPTKKRTPQWETNPSSETLPKKSATRRKRIFPLPQLRRSPPMLRTTPSTRPSLTMTTRTTKWTTN